LGASASLLTATSTFKIPLIGSSVAVELRGSVLTLGASAHVGLKGFGGYLGVGPVGGGIQIKVLEN
jgi:hypothetical protein